MSYDVFMKRALYVSFHIPEPCSIYQKPSFVRLSFCDRILGTNDRIGISIMYLRQHLVNRRITSFEVSLKRNFAKFGSKSRTTCVFLPGEAYFSVIRNIRIRLKFDYFVNTLAHIPNGEGN